MPNKRKIVSSFMKRRWLLKFNSRKALEKYQKKKLEEQYKFIMEHSAYFNQKYSNKKSLLEFDVMSKKELMDNFDSINTVGAIKDEALQVAIKRRKK